jgi:hypothetical protein
LSTGCTNRPPSTPPRPEGSHPPLSSGTTHVLVGRRCSRVSLGSRRARGAARRLLMLPGRGAPGTPKRRRGDGCPAPAHAGSSPAAHVLRGAQHGTKARSIVGSGRERELLLLACPRGVCRYGHGAARPRVHATSWSMGMGVLVTLTQQGYGLYHVNSCAPSYVELPILAMERQYRFLQNPPKVSPKLLLEPSGFDSGA